MIFVIETIDAVEGPHDTVRPDRTVAVAALVTSGVIRLSVPSWSSSPQRPQLDSVRWKARTSAAAMGARGTVGQ